MSKNDFCRCCKKNLRIHGELTNTISSFERNSKGECTHEPKRSLVTWLITLLLIICPSSYKARPDNLIGPNSFCSGIVSPQRSNARLNFPTSNVVGGAKFVWHPGQVNGIFCYKYQFIYTIIIIRFILRFYILDDHHSLIRPGCMSLASWGPVGIFCPDPEPLIAAFCSM